MIAGARNSVLRDHLVTTVAYQGSMSLVSNVANRIGRVFAYVPDSDFLMISKRELVVLVLVER